MKKKMLIMSFLLMFALIVSGCGSSGGGNNNVVANTGGGSPTTTTPTTPTTPPPTTPPVTPPATRLFFGSGSLSAVDPADPGNPIQFETANTDHIASFLHGTVNVASGQIEGTHVRGLIYANTDDGKLYEVSALTSDLLVPTQVSNETNADSICNYDSFMDLANFNNGAYLYYFPGPDTLCGTDDDDWKMVRPGMSPGTSPFPAKDIMMGLRDATGAIIGYLAHDGPNLVRCDANFENCGILITEPNVFDLAFNPLLDSVLLVGVDDTIRHYQPSTNVLSAPLYTVSQGEAIFVDKTDGSNLFFSVGPKILKLPVNGSATATTLVNEGPGTIILRVFLTQNSVVYEAGVAVGPTTAHPGDLKSISKTGGTARTLRTIVGNEFIDIASTVGNNIYYNFSSPAEKIRQIRGVVDENGTGKTELNNARWVGETLGSSISLSGLLDIQRVIGVENCPVTSFSRCVSGTLVSFDAHTNTDKTVLGTLPSDIENIFFGDSVFFGGIGNDVLGIGNTGDNTGSSDIFYVNSVQAGSLIRITSTPGIHEFPVNN